MSGLSRCCTSCSKMCAISKCTESLTLALLNHWSVRLIVIKKEKKKKHKIQTNKNTLNIVNFSCHVFWCDRAVSTWTCAAISDGHPWLYTPLGNAYKVQRLLLNVMFIVCSALKMEKEKAGSSNNKAFSTSQKRKTSALDDIIKVGTDFLNFANSWYWRVKGRVPGGYCVIRNECIFLW